MTKQAYQMTKEEFEVKYILTKEDKEAIKDSVERFSWGEETATVLRKQKVYEDLRYKHDKQHAKNIDKHLENFRKQIASYAPGYSKKIHY